MLRRPWPYRCWFLRRWHGTGPLCRLPLWPSIDLCSCRKRPDAPSSNNDVGGTRGYSVEAQPLPNVRVKDHHPRRERAHPDIRAKNPHSWQAYGGTAARTGHDPSCLIAHPSHLSHVHRVDRWQEVRDEVPAIATIRSDEELTGIGADIHTAGILRIGAHAVTKHAEAHAFAVR